MLNIDKDISKSLKDVGPYLGLGVQLAATVLIMLFIGDWLDKKFNMSPVFTLIFALFGMFAGMYNLIKQVISIGKKSDKSSK